VSSSASCWSEYAFASKAQQKYERFGAMEQRFVGNVRRPTLDDRRDPEWRALDPSRDQMRDFRAPESDPWPEDLTTLYYWRKGT
jgi:hypothetical protein